MCMDFKLLKRGLENGLDFEWELKSKCLTIEIPTNGSHFVKNRLKTGHKSP